jgi:hypothetical protein
MELGMGHFIYGLLNGEIPRYGDHIPDHVILDLELPILHGSNSIAFTDKEFAVSLSSTKENGVARPMA